MDKDEQKEVEEVQAVVYETPEEAYRGAVTAENIEDAVPAIEFLRDTINNDSARISELSDVNDAQEKRIKNLSEKLSQALLSVPVNTGAEQPADENEITETTLDDLIDDLQRF